MTDITRCGWVNFIEYGELLYGNWSQSCKGLFLKPAIPYWREVRCLIERQKIHGESNGWSTAKT